MLPIKSFCPFAPYVVLALLDIFQLVDQTTVILMAVVLMTAGESAARRSCLAKRA